MQWIVLAVLMIYVGVVIWAMLDAFDKTDLGCLWLVLFISTPVFSVIAYIIMRSIAFRRQDPPVTVDPREYGGPLKHFGSEIEKARFIEAAARGPGTMYEPDRRGAAPPGGYRHFTDNRAETLISQGLHGEAFEYLIEMYSLARDEHDGRAQDTYMYYIHRLPGGAKLLADWRRDQRLERGGDDGGGGGDEPVGGPSSREVPF